MRIITTKGGLSTRHEMCYGYLAYYPAGALDACGSNVDPNSLLRAVDADTRSINEIVASEEGKFFTNDQALSNKRSEAFFDAYDWTDHSKVERLQRINKHAPYWYFCSSQETVRTSCQNKSIALF